MPRAIWSGAISFGLVNVPVKVYSAVSQKEVRFNQLHDEDGGRIAYKRVCSVDGEEVSYDHIVKGFEVGNGEYVMIEPEELEAIAPEATRTIDIEDFVDLDDIDPIFYDKPYFLVPGKGGSKAYRVLLDAMRESNKVALARVVLRTKQYLVALRPSGDALAMITMNYADEVNDQADLDLPDQKMKVEAREIDMAQRLIEALSGPFEPERYRDEHRQRVLDMIEAKAAGAEVVAQPKAQEPNLVVDLMAALEQSLQSTRSGSSRGDGSRSSGKRGAGSRSSGTGGSSGRTKTITSSGTSAGTGGAKKAAGGAKKQASRPAASRAKSKA